uniref:Phosphate/phosphite/phosphonate ABC transporter substrate-binding protein n=1 Tax=Desulfobacca acetoxidans TaxID=60893 RepID=A0A7C3UWT6_9BACT
MFALSGCLPHRGLRWVSHLAAIFFLAAVLGGCGSDGERAVVDFNQTLPATRPGKEAPGAPALRVAVAAMISPKETFDLYRQLLEYLSRQLGKELEFVQRKTYTEINELLRRGDIDLAFICSGPYATARDSFRFKPLAVPLVHGSHFYQAFLIVKKDSPFNRLEDLRGHSFAFTDPSSNTGKLVPTYWLAEKQERPETFFGQTIYTYSHDNSILAVSRGLVDGAAVDGLIWEYYQEKKPAFTAQARVIKKSEPYGIPPLVASGSLSPQECDRLQQVLLTMHQEPQGRKILEELRIDRFLPLQEEWYEPIRRMHQEVARMREGSHAVQKP